MTPSGDEPGTVDLCVLNSLIDPRFGGPQRRSLDVARRLRGVGVETEFLVPEGPDEFATAVEDAGFEAHRIRLSRLRSPRHVGANVDFLSEFPATVTAVADLVRSRDIDVVHASMARNLQTALATTRTDASLVWHLNAQVVPRPLNRAVGLLACRWADEVVVSSRTVQRYFRLPSTVQTLYPPVDIDRFDPSTASIDPDARRAELGLPVDVPVVGTVANVNPVKGLDRFVEAIDRVVSEYGEVAVPIVGAELDSQVAYSRRLRRLRDEAGLEDTVRFVGWQSDVPELLSTFDLFVCPSLSESGPMVVLEAMAMTCPVVTTEVGLVPEQFRDGEHAWVVPPDDVGALSAAIIDALQSPGERAKRSERARATVANNLSLSHAAQRHREVYELAHAGNRR